MQVIYQDIYTPCFLVCKCGIYHLCHIFTLRFLHYLQHICDILVRCKLYFVQIYFLIQWNLLGHMYLFTCF